MALSTGIGSDTQKPFAIVIVAGLISRLFIGFFVNPVLYELAAKEGDVLQVIQKGYSLGDRVLRPARVVVSAGPPEEAQE